MEKVAVGISAATAHMKHIVSSQPKLDLESYVQRLNWLRHGMVLLLRRERWLKHLSMRTALRDRQHVPVQRAGKAVLPRRRTWDAPRKVGGD